MIKRQFIYYSDVLEYKDKVFPRESTTKGLFRLLKLIIHLMLDLYWFLFHKIMYKTITHSLTNIICLPQFMYPSFQDQDVVPDIPSQFHFVSILVAVFSL
jgi:hypothetical protein